MKRGIDLVHISELDYVGKYINVINECDIYDFIKIPKDNIDERVEILEREFRKEQKIQILEKVKTKFKEIFDKASEQFDALELPLPTSIEINYYREYDHSLFVDSYTLYDSEDRSIGEEEFEEVEIEGVYAKYSLDTEIRECVYSVDTELLMQYTDWEGYRIIFGDLHNN